MWDRDSGSLRMRGIVRALIDLGARVTFMPDNLTPVPPYTRALQRLGVEVLYGPLDVRAEMATLGPCLTGAILSRIEDYWEGEGYGLYIKNGNLHFVATRRYTDISMRLETAEAVPAERRQDEVRRALRVPPPADRAGQRQRRATLPHEGAHEIELPLSGASQ